MFYISNGKNKKGTAVDQKFTYIFDIAHCDHEYIEIRHFLNRYYDV